MDFAFFRVCDLLSGNSVLLPSDIHPSRFGSPLETGGAGIFSWGLGFFSFGPSPAAPASRSDFSLLFRRPLFFLPYPPFRHLVPLDVDYFSLPALPSFSLPLPPAPGRALSLLHNNVLLTVGCFYCSQVSLGGRADVSYAAGNGSVVHGRADLLGFLEVAAFQPSLQYHRCPRALFRISSSCRLFFPAMDVTYVLEPFPLLP